MKISQESRDSLYNIQKLSADNTVGDIKRTINELLDVLETAPTDAHSYNVSADWQSTYMNPAIKGSDAEVKKQLIDWCLIHLGYPLITVELTEQHFNVAIADALTLYSKYASFQNKYLAVPLSGYNQEEGGLDLSEWNVAVVKNIVTRRDRMFGTGGNDDILFGWPAFLNGQFGGMPYFGSTNSIGQNWSGGFITYHNFHEFMELARRMAGSNPDWIYDKYTKKLLLIPVPSEASLKENEVILMEVECEPSIAELCSEEYFRRIVLAYCKIMLGTIRSKFGSVQLIGGGNINTDIGQEGKEELNNIIENILRDTSIGQQCYIY